MRSATAAHVLVRILQLVSSPTLDITETIDRELPRIHANAVSLIKALPADEHLVAINSDGSVRWVIEGTARAAVIDRELDADLYRANAGIVLVHNHPNSASLSGADLEHLGKPGVASIVVVGHDGSIYTARAGRRYETTEFIGSLYPLARNAVTQQLRIQRPSGRVSTHIIDAQFEHLVALSLHKAEIIRYRAIFPNARQATDAGWLRLSGLVTNSVAAKLKAAIKNVAR